MRYRRPSRDSPLIVLVEQMIGVMRAHKPKLIRAALPELDAFAILQRQKQIRETLQSK
jgi:hypothetical protein